MIYGENKKFSLGHELSQKREIKSWGHKKKSSFLGKKEKKMSLMNLQSLPVISVKL